MQDIDPDSRRRGPGAHTDPDLDIVAILKANGRATNKLIARKLGISEPTVAQRIRRMIENRQIRIVAQRIISRSSPNALSTVVEVFLDDFGKLDLAARALADIPEVLTVYSTLGRPELVAHFWSESRAGLTETVRRIGRHTPGLIRLNVMPVLDLALYRSEYGALSVSYGGLSGNAGNTREDMLRLLSENARQSIRSLALQLDVPESTARAHLAAISRDPSVRFCAVMEARHFGKKVWADIRASVDPKRIEEVMKSLEDRENLSLVAHISGPENLALFCIEESIKGLSNFVDQTVRFLPGIADFRVLRVPLVHSHNHHYSL